MVRSCAGHVAFTATELTQTKADVGPDKRRLVEVVRLPGAIGGPAPMPAMGEGIQDHAQMEQIFACIAGDHGDRRCAGRLRGQHCRT